MEQVMARYGSTIIILLIWVAIFYFLIIRPSKKKKEELKKLHSNLKEGVEIITIGGIKGSVAYVGEEYVEIRIDKGVKMTILKSAISRIIEQ